MRQASSFRCLAVFLLLQQCHLADSKQSHRDHLRIVGPERDELEIVQGVPLLLQLEQRKFEEIQLQPQEMMGHLQEYRREYPSSEEVGLVHVTTLRRKKRGVIWNQIQSFKKGIQRVQKGLVSVRNRITKLLKGVGTTGSGSEQSTERPKYPSTAGDGGPKWKGNKGGSNTGGGYGSTGSSGGGWGSTTGGGGGGSSAQTGTGWSNSGGGNNNNNNNNGGGGTGNGWGQAGQNSNNNNNVWNAGGGTNNGWSNNGGSGNNGNNNAWSNSGGGGGGNNGWNGNSNNNQGGYNNQQSGGYNNQGGGYSNNNNQQNAGGYNNNNQGGGGNKANNGWSRSASSFSVGDRKDPTPGDSRASASNTSPATAPWTTKPFASAIRTPKTTTTTSQRPKKPNAVRSSRELEMIAQRFDSKTVSKLF